MKLTPVMILKVVQPFLAQLYIKKCPNNNSERFILLLLSHSLWVRGLHPHLHFWKPLICRTWVKQPFSSFSETVTHPSWLSWCSAGLPVPTHVFSSSLGLRSGFCDSHSDTLTVLSQPILPPLWKNAWGRCPCPGLGLLISWDGVSKCSHFCEFCAAPICPAAKKSQ